MDVALELAQAAKMPLPLGGLVDQLVKQINQERMKARCLPEQEVRNKERRMNRLSWLALAALFATPSAAQDELDQGAGRL